MLIPSWVKSSLPSKSQNAERPSAWYQRASRALTTNQPSVFATSPSGVCSNSASGTTSEAYRVEALFPLRKGLPLNREQLELVAAAVNGVLERDLLPQCERDCLAAVCVLAAGDSDLNRLAVLRGLHEN